VFSFRGVHHMEQPIEVYSQSAVIAALIERRSRLHTYRMGSTPCSVLIRVVSAPILSISIRSTSPLFRR
jgi:hypothetical protein